MRIRPETPADLAAFAHRPHSRRAEHPIVMAIPSGHSDRSRPVGVESHAADLSTIRCLRRRMAFPQSCDPHDKPGLFLPLINAQGVGDGGDASE